MHLRSEEHTTSIVAVGRLGPPWVERGFSKDDGRASGLADGIASLPCLMGALSHSGETRLAGVFWTLMNVAG